MDQEEEDKQASSGLQSAEDGSGSCSPPNMVDFTEVSMHVSEQDDLQISICKSLLQIPQQHWKKIEEGVIDSVTHAYMADFIMDLHQVLSQSILTILLPYLHRRMTANPTFSIRIHLTEEHVSIFMDNQVREALAMSFSTETVLYSKDFSQLLARTITKTTNNVLTLCSQTPIRKGVLPVFFVTGTGCSLFDLSQLCQETSAVLKSGISLTENDEPIEPERDVFENEDYCVLNCLKENHLRDFLIAYLTRLVNTLRISSSIPHHKCDSSSDCCLDICHIVGSNSEILTVDQESSPVVVPVKNYETQNDEIWPFSSAEVPLQNNCRIISPAEVEAIEQTAEDLVNALWTTTEEELDHIYQDTADMEALRILTTGFTHRIFRIIMGTYSDQVHLIPVGLRMGELVTFRSAHSNDPGLIAHCVYLKTEEVITRAAVLVLHWVGWYRGSQGIHASIEPNEVPDRPQFVIAPGGGDYLILLADDDSDESEENEEADEDDEDYEDDDEEEEDADEEEEEQQQPPCQSSMLLTNMTRASLMVLISGEILTLIGITDVQRMEFLLRKMVTELDLDSLMKEPYDAIVMGRSYRDISHGAIRDLLDWYGSISALYHAFNNQGFSFAEVLKEVIKNQLTIPAANIEASEVQVISVMEHTKDEMAQSSCWDRFVSMLRAMCCLRVPCPSS